MTITKEDMARVLERVRDHRAGITEGDIALTDFELDVIITALEIGAEV